VVDDGGGGGGDEGMGMVMVVVVRRKGTTWQHLNQRLLDLGSGGPRRRHW